MGTVLAGDNGHDVTIVIATYGHQSWIERARTVAMPSTIGQGAKAVIQWHGSGLAQARNAAAELADSEWLCFLDADDELEPGYLDALMAADGDLRAPAARFVVFDPVDRQPFSNPAVTFEQRDMNRINPCVIGTLIRRDMFVDVGGFWKERAWEDWSLFRRCWLLGATITHTEAAVYRVNPSPDGRNSTVHHPKTLHQQITRSHDRWLQKRRIDDRIARHDRRST